MFNHSRVPFVCCWFYSMTSPSSSVNITMASVMSFLQTVSRCAILSCLPSHATWGYQILSHQIWKWICCLKLQSHQRSTPLLQIWFSHQNSRKIWILIWRTGLQLLSYQTWELICRFVYWTAANLSWLLMTFIHWECDLNPHFPYTTLITHNIYWQSVYPLTASVQWSWDAIQHVCDELSGAICRNAGHSSDPQQGSHPFHVHHCSLCSHGHFSESGCRSRYRRLVNMLDKFLPKTKIYQISSWYMILQN